MHGIYRLIRRPCLCASSQQTLITRRQNRVIPALLLLILATLVAGPLGFFVVGALLLAWTLVTGTLHLAIDLILLPFRIVGALLSGGRS